MGEAEHEVGNSPSRVFLTADELESADKEQFLQHWYKQEQYINSVESKLSSVQSTTSNQIREWEEKLRQSQSESARRESILLMRLNAKEQEMQDLIVQIQELKASQAASAVSLRSSLLDPAVNLLIQHLRKELEKAKSALEETQNELSAWKFTPDSNTGKRLMAKCRLLYQENEELGRMISSGRLAKLEGDLALQRNFSEEMKKSQSELDEFLLELDEDVEGMQSTIYFLQQQLRQTRDQLATVQKENELLRSIGSSHSQHPAAVTSGSATNKVQEKNESRDSAAENRYSQANGTSDHSVNQSCSSPVDAMDYDKVGPSVKHQQPQQQPQQPEQRSPVSSNQQGCSTVHTLQRRESEPDSNNFESGHESAMEGTSAMEEEDEEVEDEDVAEGPEEERIGEADTTGNNNNEVADSERAGHVVPGSVCQAVPDEGLNPRFSANPLSHPAPRTSNGSGEGSPDDGAGHSSSSMMVEASIPDHAGPDNSLNENSSDLVYNRADSGPGTSTVSPRHRNDRNSTEVGDLVSGSGMEDESDFRTSGSSVNGETRAVGRGAGSGGGSGGSTLAGALSAEVTTSDESLRDSESEAVVGGGGSVRRNTRDDEDDDDDDDDNNRSSAKCRKRTASQTEADAATTKFRSSGRLRSSNNQAVSGSEDNNPEAGVSSRSGSSSGSKGVSLRKRFRNDETVANGEANDDDDQDNNP